MDDFNSEKENQKNGQDNGQLNGNGNNNQSQNNQFDDKKISFFLSLKKNTGIKWVLSFIVLGLLLYNSIAGTNFFNIFSGNNNNNNNNSSSIPSCGSKSNVALLQQTLSNHPNWTQNIYGFNPNKQYSVNGIYIFQADNATLNKSFCKASITIPESNGKTNIIDIYYTLQNSIGGNNTEIEILNPFNL